MADNSKMFSIGSVARQIQRTCEYLIDMAYSAGNGKGNSPGLQEAYSDVVMDEVEHIQRMVLELTRLAIEAAADETVEEAPKTDEAEGSVFAPGELESSLGDKTHGKKPVK